MFDAAEDDENNNDDNEDDFFRTSSAMKPFPRNFLLKNNTGTGKYLGAVDDSSDDNDSDYSADDESY